ncbi:MAG: aminoglycoside phosphotransferase family protein [Actinomycetota bacterium]
MPAAGLGERVAEGRTSVVYAYGTDSVVKVPRPDVPPHWPRTEAAIAEVVHRAGLPCPAVRDLVDVDGRQSIVFERIDGPSVWDLLRDRPDHIDEHAALLADIQHEIHGVTSLSGPPELAAVPPIAARMVTKIQTADGLTDDERAQASALVESLPGGPSLCHGDLHPGNVLMSDSGPRVIDWFDAVIGPPEADVVRTSLLVRAPSRPGALPAHLPGARPALLEAFHLRYVARAVARSGRDWLSPEGAASLLRWERALAAGRLAEQIAVDEADLLALWRGPGWDPGRSGLARALVELGVSDERLELVVDPGR